MMDSFIFIFVSCGALECGFLHRDAMVYGPQFPPKSDLTIKIANQLKKRKALISFTFFLRVTPFACFRPPCYVM